MDVEAIRLAMFAHAGVKSVDDVRLFHTESGGPAVIATIALASPDVDQAVVRATVAQVLQEQFGVREVELLRAYHRDIHRNHVAHCGKANSGFSCWRPLWIESGRRAEAGWPHSYRFN